MVILAPCFVFSLIVGSGIEEYTRASVLKTPTRYEKGIWENLRRDGHSIFAVRPRIISLFPPRSLANEEVRPVYPIGMNASTSKNAQIRDFDRPFYDECEPIDDWQTRFYSTCNSFHEMDISALDDDGPKARVLSTLGSRRLVWKVRPRDKTLVLKTLHFRREFDSTTYPFSIVDAIVMERLTSSPFIVNAYGFCGQSVFTEYAPEAARFLIQNDRFSTKRDGILLARNLAIGMHDLHYIGNSSEPTFCHNDINTANLIQRSNGIKYNDFNIGFMLRRNSTSKKPCGFPAHFVNPEWNAPEEIRNKKYVSEKIDIFSLGYIYYLILTKQDGWKLEPGGHPPMATVEQMKVDGVLPFLPEQYANTTVLEERAMIAAYRACFQYDPNNRPTARVLREAFETVIDWSKKQKTATDNELRELFHLVE